MDGKVEVFATACQDKPFLWPNDLCFGPDGMAFSKDDRLYETVFNRGRVAVMDSEGRVVENVSTRGQKPTNVAFGLPGDKRIYVTENEFGALKVFDAGVDGLPLYC